MMVRRCLLTALMAWPAMLLAHGDVAHQDATLDSARYEQRIGHRIPSGLVFADESGQPLPLESLIGDQPLVLVMSWFDCPNLCPMVLDGLARSAARVDFMPGRDYRVAAVSIAPDEGPAQARALRAGLGDGAGSWALLTGSSGPIDRLAEAVGFRYAYDAEADRYAHPAGLVVIAPDGRVSRYLFGLSPDPNDLERALIDASQGQLGSVVQQIVLRCFRYNAESGSYSLAIWSGLRIAAVLTLGLLAMLVWWLHRRAQRSVVHG